MGQPQVTESSGELQAGIKLVSTKNPSVFNVQLRLPHKTVYPGILDFTGEGSFRCKRKPEHKYHKLDAWGVCAEVIDKHPVRWISIVCDGREYVTSRQFLLKFGRRITFKNYETQYLLPVNLWGLDLVRSFEKQEAAQLSLFHEVA